MSFVPHDFVVPRRFDFDGFVLEPLGPEHNESDHEAWSSSIDHIRATPGFAPGAWGDDTWPYPMDLEANLADLRMHADEFAERKAFAYTVLDATTRAVVGCVYVDPHPTRARHAVVRSWVRAGRAAADVPLAAAVARWLRTGWPLEQVDYVGRRSLTASIEQGLIALDVDGTLLTSTGDVSPRTRAALRAATDAGWHVVVATGRPLAVALPVVHELDLGEYVIAANGATVAELASDRVLFQASLPGAAVLDVIERARDAVPELRLATTTRRGFIFEPGFDIVAPITIDEGEEVADARPLASDEVLNLVLFALDLDAETLLSCVAAHASDQVAVSPTGLASSVELTPPGVHKGSGLARLCEHLGVPRTDVVAFGDGVNDHEMLVWAGIGVAMGNARPPTKAVADDVTATNDDDGIALIVEHLLHR